MTKLDALRILKLLSALESWAYSTGNPLPDSISDDFMAFIAQIFDPCGQPVYPKLAQSCHWLDASVVTQMLQ